MSEQRRLSRRALLAATGALAGCTGVLGAGNPVTVLAAGSLQPALPALQQAVDARVESEAIGSVAATRLVERGRRDPDLLVLADTALFDRLDTWYASIATNALTVAYSDRTQGGRAVRRADDWFEPLLSGAAQLGRTDPDLDPLGYRTLFMLGLAAAYYERPALADRVLARDQVYPETGLLSQFETGSIDAAVVYRNMAVDRGYPHVDLPAAIDLSDPAYADRYATQRYDLPEGGVARGDVIEYGATMRHDRGAARDVFETLAAGDWLDDHGFTIPERYPTYVGDPPQRLA